VVVIKQDSSPQICVHYHALNAITTKDAHPISNINECFPHFGKAKCFTILDLKSGYWQILLDKEAKLRAAFSTRYRHFQWNVPPFGLINAPGSFQCRINQILVPFLEKFVISYMDDILIYLRTIEEHYEHVKEILMALQEAQMILNIGKCEFFVSEVKFLGHIVSADGIRPDPENIANVVEWPVPKTITDVRGFNNLANHYARYIENFVELAFPLTDLQKGSLRKETLIEWMPECQEAFNKIKRTLMMEPILRHHNIEKPFILDLDSSQY